MSNYTTEIVCKQCMQCMQLLLCIISILQRRRPLPDCLSVKLHRKCKNNTDFALITYSLIWSLSSSHHKHKFNFKPRFWLWIEIPLHFQQSGWFQLNGFFVLKEVHMPISIIVEEKQLCDQCYVNSIVEYQLISIRSSWALVEHTLYVTSCIFMLFDILSLI